jgi:membrane protein implicated in regulation of membrane protease activity
MNAHSRSTNVCSVVASTAGWMLLFLAFTLLALTFVLFAIWLGEFRMADAGFTSLLTGVALGGVLAFGAALALILLGRRLRRKSTKRGLCPACGYDLRGRHANAQANVCPECGENA